MRLPVTVHGFRRSKYNVTEGQSVDVQFLANVKGESQYRRLGLPLLGTITSEAVTAGKSTSLLQTGING